MKLLLVVALAAAFLCLSLQLVKSDENAIILTLQHPNSSVPGPSNSTNSVTSSATPIAVNTTAAPSVISNSTANVEPTAAAKSTVASKPTSPSKNITTEAVKPTPAKSNVTVATPKPVLPSVTATPKAAAAQVSSSGFSAGSFIGGIVLTLGLLAIGYVGCRTYHTKRGVQYRTIDEHDAII